VPNKYTSANNNSNELENTIRSFISTYKELNKEFIAKLERQDALNEKLDLLTQEVCLVRISYNKRTMRKPSNMCKK
jgi:uncharacterized coiled-coil DUF342 family protein